MVPICLACLSAIFKYLYQCIYGDRSGYISEGEGQHQLLLELQLRE